MCVLSERVSYVNLRRQDIFSIILKYDNVTCLAAQISYHDKLHIDVIAISNPVLG